MKRGKKIALALLFLLLLAGLTAGAFLFLNSKKEKETPESLLLTYMSYITTQEYDKMYAMLDVESSGNISQEEFTQRNSAIYEGMEVFNLRVEILETNDERHTVRYQTSFDTVAGPLSFESKALFLDSEEGLRLVWNDDLIVPGLERTDKVRVTKSDAKRGEILDRNGRMLAGDGVAASVGIVPGELEDKESALLEMSALLDMEVEAIEKKLSASWVKDGMFVPIKTLNRVSELALMAPEPDENLLEEKARQDQLLTIPGVRITDIQVRSYPLKEAAAHLVGYVQNVTAEDLEEHAGEGYTVNSVIGRSGMESLFEKELKGQNGCRIYIEDAQGNEKAELASIPVQDGADIQLTIDSELQSYIYEKYKEDKGCSAALDPTTGEVLALVNAPSYDTNTFVIGMSVKQWDELNADEARPLLNRFRQTWCPGSSFKPIVAAIGLETGAIDPHQDYGAHGLSWQKDSSWGSYFVTTLHAYEPVTLENAMIYSDNIYFAKAALNIGKDTMENSLQSLGFGTEVPFEIKMGVSTYSNTEAIESEIQLADSGYGQGQIMMNPLHLASLYTAFVNEGNILKPTLLYQENGQGEYWMEQAFSADTASLVLEDLTKVVSQEDGTGHTAYRADMALAGKTGTAEIKASQDDINGTELGWFTVMTTDTVERPILLVSMVEDVKGRGGSGYVVSKSKEVLDYWFDGIW